MYNVYLKNARVNYGLGCLINNEINNGKGEDDDDKADNGIEDGVFGFLDFGNVALGGHILDATDDDKQYGQDPGDADNDVDDGNDGVWETVFGSIVSATGGFSDGIGDTITSTNVGTGVVGRICWS